MAEGRYWYEIHWGNNPELYELIMAYHGLNIDDAEQAAGIIDAIAKDEDKYGITDFSNWFFEEHNEEWVAVLDTLREMERLYVSEKLPTALKVMELSKHCAA
jgi:hypothetical protein